MSATNPERRDDFISAGRTEGRGYAGTYSYSYVGNHWYSWYSPVGMGLFFLLIAVAVEVVRYAFH